MTKADLIALAERSTDSDPLSADAIRRMLELPAAERRGFMFGLEQAAKEHDKLADFYGAAGWWKYQLPGESDRDRKVATSHRGHATTFRAIAGKCQAALRAIAEEMDG